MSRTRQEKQSSEIRSRILDIARRIVCDEGVEALSVRRITSEMDYSAGIIYHYFENKEQILSTILLDVYQRILSSIHPPNGKIPPDELLMASAKSFIQCVLECPAEYKAVMLDTSPQVLAFTSVLGEGTCEKQPAMMAMVATLEAGISDGVFAPCDVQLTAQAIWSATFGLLMRLIIERDVGIEQRTKLIERQINLIMKGLRP